MITGGLSNGISIVCACVSVGSRAAEAQAERAGRGPAARRDGGRRLQVEGAARRFQRQVSTYHLH